MNGEITKRMRVPHGRVGDVAPITASFRFLS
jgi:hypothetical protein